MTMETTSWLVELHQNYRLEELRTEGVLKAPTETYCCNTPVCISPNSYRYQLIIRVSPPLRRWQNFALPELAKRTSLTLHSACSFKDQRETKWRLIQWKADNFIWIRSHRRALILFLISTSDSRLISLVVWFLLSLLQPSYRHHCALSRSVWNWSRARLSFGRESVVAVSLHIGSRWYQSGEAAWLSKITKKRRNDSNWEWE